MIKFEIVKDFKDQLEEAHLPQRGTSASAWYDFKSAKDIVIPSHLFNCLSILQGLQHPQKPLTLDEIKAKLKEYNIKPVLVPTGVKAIMPDNYYLSLDNRSSIPLNSLLIVANGRGIIDADYQYADNDGHIHVMLINLSPFPIEIKKGDRIAQGIFHTYETLTEEVSNNTKRSGGFGHTGVN